MQIHPGLVQVLHVIVDAAPALAQIHDGSDIVRRGEDVGIHHRLLRLRDEGGVRIGCGVVDLQHFAIGHGDAVNDAGYGGDQIQVELALQTLGNDLQVEKSEESAAEPEAQGPGCLRFVGQGRVVEGQLRQGVLQGFVIPSVRGVDAAKHHGNRLAVSGEGLLAGSLRHGDGVTDTGIRHVLDAGSDVSDFSGGELAAGLVGEGAHMAHLHHLEFGSRRHHADAVSGLYLAVEDTNIGDDSLVTVIGGVKDQALQRRIRIPLRRGDVGDDPLQDFLHVGPQLRGNERSDVRGDPHEVLQLDLAPLRIRRDQVDLVDDRKDLQIVVHRQIGVGQGLRLHSLGGVHDEDRPFAGNEGTGHLIVEVHMSGGVDEIEFVCVSIFRLVGKGDSAGLDGDAALLLQFHSVQQLAAHIARRNRPRQLQNAVCQGGLSMIDMGDDGEISDEFLFIVFHVKYIIKKSFFPDKILRRNSPGKIRFCPTYKSVTAQLIAAGMLHRYTNSPQALKTGLR